MTTTTIATNERSDESASPNAKMKLNPYTDDESTTIVDSSDDDSTISDNTNNSNSSNNNNIKSTDTTDTSSLNIQDETCMIAIDIAADQIPICNDDETPTPRNNTSTKTGTPPTITHLPISKANRFIHTSFRREATPPTCRSHQR
jgi:hypothetical protein